MEKIYKNAGFWIRLLARMIDFTIIAIFSNALLFICISNVSGTWQFKNPYLFYVWSFFTCILVLFIFVGIPILTKGWSLGYKLCKIRVVTNGPSLTRSIINREMLYGISWAFIILMTIIFINHTLIFKISNRSINSKVKLTNWEQTRLSVVASISSILFFIQAFVAITIIPSKNKTGFHDRLAGSFVVKGKVQLVENKKQVIEIKPMQIKNTEVEWVK